MRLIRYIGQQGPTLGVRKGDDIIDIGVAAPDFPRDPVAILALGAPIQEALRAALQRRFPSSAVTPFASARMLTPIANPQKIICIGMNYVDHVKEAPTPHEIPTYPVVFLRQVGTLIAHGDPLRRPMCSEQFDFEGELVCVIGKRGRHIAKADALSHVAAYSLFNDASVRDFQFKSPQWTMGKNFDATGAFGPELVTADELPPGAVGLTLETRLNGAVVQSASTSDMIFNIATQISLLSEAMTLVPGDVIVTGTPSGVGLGRKPPLWMKHGDTCEISIEGVGLLRNPIRDEKDE